ncbi:MAG: DUF3883 domain-containing protein, partial [Gammaproteobacteria bacterium]|nr:DUF3883 domain-containing protein [Gammaproteobacteria bacterium]
MDKMQCWLLLEKSDANRISKGIDGYRDMTGESYNYDSFVPNHTNIAVGDFVVLRLDDQIVGIGRVGSISSHADVKQHRRCPDCKSTDIRERVILSPPFKCGKCSFEFSEPIQTSATITAFQAAIVDFSRLANPPRVAAVKACALSGKGIGSQLSILALDAIKLRTLLEGVQIQDSPNSSTPNGQGLGLTSAERKAIEMQAMLIARQTYEADGWQVIDTSSSKPYDLIARKEARIRYIEVKGTTGSGHSIILTQG